MKKNIALANTKLFEMVGKNVMTVEQKDTLLVAFQQKVRGDFLKEDAPSLLDSEEMIKIEEMERQKSDWIPYLSEKLPNLEYVLHEKTLSLENELVKAWLSSLQNCAGSRDNFSTLSPDESLELQKRLDASGWKAIAECLKYVPSDNNPFKFFEQALGISELPALYAEEEMGFEDTGHPDTIDLLFDSFPQAHEKELIDPPVLVHFPTPDISILSAVMESPVVKEEEAFLRRVPPGISFSYCVNVRDKLYNDALAEAFKTLLIRHQADAPFDHFFMSIGDLRAAADQYSHWEDRYKEYNYNDLQDKLEFFILCLEDLDSLALLSNRDFKKFLAFLKANRHRRFFFFGDFRLTTATFSARMRDLETALNIHAVDASQISINEAGILHEMLRSTGMEISRSADKTLVHAWSYFRRLHQEERMGDILRGFAEKSEFEALAGRQKREKRILSSSAFEWVGMPRNFGRRTSGRPQALTELDALVGMAEVKSEIERLASHALISGQKAAAGLPVRSHNLSFLFLGNPGTGKTTVARILAQSLRELGVLKKGHLVPAHRGTLIAPYSGQTAPLVTEIFLSALDGVLFVDEAYALHTGSSHDDYGREALDTLTLLMSEYAGRIAVIFAGYPKEMENMLRSVNPGLRERFAQKILFDDYTEDELWEIFSNKLRSAQLVLKDDGVGFVRQAITRLYKNRNDRFANAREIDNLFQNLVSIQEARLASQVYRRLKTRASKLALLTRPDCEQLLKSERSQRAQEKRHPVGFRWNSDTDSRSEQRPVCKSLM